MQVAEVLSDLTSLRVCDPAAALALVSASSAPPTANNTAAIADPSAAAPATEDKASNATKASDEERDPDLQRARDLLALHAAFKGDGGARSAGLAQELREMRERVRRAVGVAVGTRSGAAAAAMPDEYAGEEDGGFDDWD